MDNQIQIETQLETGLRKFEERVKNTGLLLWARIFKKKHSELKAARQAKDKAIYGELMQIESIAKECDSEQSKIVIRKVQRLKRMLCLAILFFGLVSTSFQAIHTVRRDAVRGGYHQIIRKREQTS